MSHYQGSISDCYDTLQEIKHQFDYLNNTLKEVLERMPSLPTDDEEVVEIDCSDQGRIMHHLEKALEVAKASYPKTVLRIEFAMHSFREI